MNNNSLFKVRGGWMLPSFYTILLLFCVAIVSAQNVPVRGTISDAQGVLPGVNIQIKNKAIATVTDANGNFDIQALPEDTLIVSSMGYLTIEIHVGSQTTFNLTLIEDATALEEVTVNAGYYKVKDKERTGSIASIKAADIELQPVSNPLATMQGRMAGVNITQASGVAGGGFSIQIRGINSLRAEGNEPLYIVDGVPYGSQSLGNTSVSGNAFAALSSPLNNINPSDIENIEVLKDADATAIYGSRGANGVILITTKKGKEGKTKYNFQSYTSAGSITRKIDLMNTAQYLAMRYEAFANDSISTYPDNAYDVNGTWSNQKSTDWQKELIGGTSYSNNYNALVSGGTNSTQFLLSGTFRKETTVFPGDAHYTKGAFHSSLTHRSADNKFSLNLSTDYSSDKNNLPGIDLTSRALTIAPNAPSLNTTTGDLNWENGTFQNPLGFLKSSYLNKSNTLLSNAVLGYSFNNGINLKTNIGYTELQLSETRLRPASMHSPHAEATSADSQLFINNGKRYSWIFEPQLSWEHKWSQLNINMLAGATFQSQTQQSLALSGTGFASDALINTLAAAKTVEILTDQTSEYNYNAFFARININFVDRYILNFTGRRDGSSRFGPDKRFANFAAVGAAWIFSNEPLKKSEKGLFSFGKLRTSYGVTGSDQIGDYQYLDTYGITSNIYDGIIGIEPTRLFNPDFGWETNKKFEAALDLGFLNDRIFITASYFNNRSSNQLVGVPLPATTGFSSLQSNLDATVQNSGLELEWRSLNAKTKNLTWLSTVNITISKNKLTEFPNLEGSTYSNKLVIGESLNIVKLYHYLGIDNETGLYTFEDHNNDGELSASEDKYKLLDTSPKFYGGFSNQLSYNDWSLDFLFQFVKQDAASVLSYFPITGSMSNQPSSISNHYPQQSDAGALQLFSTGASGEAVSAYNNYVESDAMIVDASYIRLKSLSISYSISQIGSKSFSAKIYLQGQNLATFTKYNGADPENQSVLFLPPLRQYTLGIQLTL
ncbi:MAG: SusC/RagA family TonB-linked outer membrane protein [Candidatus Saccharimonadaceae bacterium]